MKKFPVNKLVQEFASHFYLRNYSVYIVGGTIRNYLLRKGNNDYDFATDAPPKEVLKMFKTVIPTGIKHGTVTVVYKGNTFEVTTFRTEKEYIKHRRPKEVEFISSLKEDLKRRDFTINAMAVDPRDGLILDYHGGLKDLKERTIRAIGVPQQRFEEDALRILRGCRFASQLNFKIEEQTMAAMTNTSKNLKAVSSERVRDEFLKIIESLKPSVGLLAMKECSALATLLPELLLGENVQQKGSHERDVFTHNLAACDAVKEDKPLIRIAALFHDIGKPVVKAKDNENSVTFYRHEQVSTEMAKEILERLKFSNADKYIILNLIANHMFKYDETATDGAIRRFINRVGYENIDDLFTLRVADRMATNNTLYSDDLVQLKERIEEVLEKSNALSIKDLDIDGNRLAALGIPKGPQMGLVLNYLLESVLDDPKQNEGALLEKIGLNYFKNYLFGNSI
ncbi:MAG: CCA tRNA nucleotidyltransferase [Sphaerochaetaceae bacterium]